MLLVEPPMQGSCASTAVTHAVQVCDYVKPLVRSLMTVVPHAAQVCDCVKPLVGSLMKGSA